MSEGKSVVYAFGPFRLNPSRWLLERWGEPVPLTPRAFDTLLALVANRTRVVTKEELLQMVWKGAFVDENNLSQAISAVRKALGDGSKGDRYVTTVPRRGYSFVAPVVETRDAQEPSEPAVAPAMAAPPFEEPARASEASAPQPVSNRRRWPGAIAALMAVGAGVGLWMSTRAASSGSTGVRSIAVLPFTSIGISRPEDHLGLGIAEAVVSRLTRSQGLLVRPVSSARRAASAGGDAAAAGRRLGVDGVLEGTLERSTGRVRATVSLVRVRDGRVLWSDSFDERESEQFLLEDAISDRLVGELSLRIPPSKGKRIAAPPGREAYEAYLRGRYFWNRRSPENLQKAIREFETALAADPRFALAWSGIADTRVLRGTDEPGEFRLARSAAEKALSLDPDLADAHASLAMAEFFGDWNFAGAEREFRRALHLAPGYATAHHWHAYWLAAMGRFDEAIAEIRRAREIDPTSLAVNRDVGHILLYARRYDEAGAALRSALAMDASYFQARFYLIADLAHAGRFAEASAELRAHSDSMGSEHVRAWEALLGAQAGHGEALRRLLPERVRAAESGAAPPEGLAADYGWLGEMDEAFPWLERAVREHRFYLVFLKVDPQYDPLRSDPRFADVVRRVGLP